MAEKSAAVLPATPRNPHRSQALGTAPRTARAEFGARLLHEREQKNRTLRDIADTTKIAVHQLRSLERGDLHRLPGGIYRRAIVRQYAAAVGLSEEDTLRDLANVSTEADDDLQRPEVAAVARGDAGSSSLTTALWSSAAALLVLGVVAALAIAWYRAGAPAPEVDMSVTAADVLTSEASVPAIESVAATDGVHVAAEAVDADAGRIDPATEPAVLLKEPEPNPNRAPANSTEGELRITSDPPGAQITVNGIGWGATPMTIPYMPFGKKVIRATKPGYRSMERDFDFIPDRRARSVRVQLSPESPETR